MAKKPTAHRFFVACWVVAATLATTPVWAAPPNTAGRMLLTEATAVRSALGRPALGALTRSNVALEQAVAVERGLWPNPEIGYAHDHVFGDEDEMEQAVVLSQQFEISGRRALHAAASERRARAAELSGEGQQLDVATRARRHFYEVLYRQARHEAVVAWIARLRGALRLVEQRKKAGDASRYEEQRIARELRTARAERATEAAARDAAWVRLAAWMGQPTATTASWPRVTGRLLPVEGASGGGALRPLAQRPEARALQLEIEAAGMDERAADRGWVPELGLTAGWRSVAAGDERRHGFVAELSLTLPFADHGQADAAKARALGARAAARRELLLQSAAGETAATRGRLTTLAQAARQFRQESSQAGASLVRMAE